MGLTEYKKKRDFKKTNEPEGVVRKPTSKAGGGSFVIQKHAASHLHYDFRLEMEGVLKSWAVPKGPSMNPKDKRLAMQVEDHPLDYGDFEGTIPEGEYGGGTVMLWDQGDWEPMEKGADMLAQLTEGSMKFLLKGQRLQGAFALVLMKGGKYGDNKKNWLLIKERDDQATEKSITDQYTTSVTTDRAMDAIAAGQKSGAGAADKKAGVRVWTGIKKATNQASVMDPSTIDGAAKSKFPATMKPQLATLVQSAPDGGDWVHEIKFDGYRFIALIENGNVTLSTRNGKDWTSKFPDIAAELACLPIESAIVDGELVALDAEGVTRFQLLQKSIKGTANPALAFYAFDLIYLNGYMLKACTLSDRKNLLRQLMQTYTPSDAIRFSEHFKESGDDVWTNACRMGLEGIISKDLTSRYVEKRSNSWVKVKCTNRQEFVIGGYTEPGGSRQGMGALLVGFYNEAKDLIYSGKVGTGFTDASLKEIHGQLTKIEQKTSPFSNPPKGSWTRGIHWVEPKLIGEVAYTEMTSEGLLRHPSFQGLREDKKADAVTIELPKQGKEAAEKTPAKAASKTKSAAAEKTAAAKKSSPVEKPTITLVKMPKETTSETKNTVTPYQITSPEKILFPDEKYTKKDLADYYEAVQERAYQWQSNRPLTLVRCPAGRSKPCFYQRHIKLAEMPGIEPVNVDVKGGEEIYIFMSDPIALQTLVQQSTLEIHGWQCRADDIEHPDRMVFDVDPSPEVEWAGIIKAAKTLKSLLEKCGFETFAMTTGGKGLHVVVPLVPSADWDDVGSFAEAIARYLEATDPDNYTANMSKKKRIGKVYVDFLRNRKTASAVLPYSSRARAGATVATPIAWSEVTVKLDPTKFTIKTVPGRLAQQKSDPWKDYELARKALKLEEVLDRLTPKAP